MAELTYNVVELTLSGNIDGKTFHARAYSGGRAGSKKGKVVHPMLANNPFATGVKLGDTNPGGTLPLGTYELKTHESRKNWIRLNPVAGTNMHGRAGFAVHGRGQRGSDGCIVPQDFENVLSIYALVKTREQAGRPAPTLEVVATGDIDAIQRRMQTWANTA